MFNVLNKKKKLVQALQVWLLKVTFSFYCCKRIQSIGSLSHPLLPELLKLCIPLPLKPS